jgi:hypothetical protein
MKHIRTYEKYRITKNRDEIIKEAVLQVNDIYKVKTMIDIPQSLINSYVKKVKETTGKNLRQFFGDVDIAEEIVKYINMNNLDVEKIPGGALMGGQEETQVQAQEPQAQIQIEPQAQMQAQPQVQPEAQQAQPEAQGEFEEPQVQAQDGQSQVQAQGQGQVQPETQGQVQPQAQEEDEEDEEELPL